MSDHYQEYTWLWEKDQIDAIIEWAAEGYTPKSIAALLTAMSPPNLKLQITPYLVISTLKHFCLRWSDLPKKTKQPIPLDKMPGEISDELREELDSLQRVVNGGMNNECKYL
jgi:hypothetical protein